MPIRIRPFCRHCGKAVEQGADAFSPWYHSGRGDDADSRWCDPTKPATSTLAIPQIDVVKLGES